MTAAVALSITSDMVSSNPVSDGAMLPCGLCGLHLGLPDDLFMQYSTGQVDLLASLSNSLLANLDIVPDVRSSLIVAVFNGASILEDQDI